MTRPTPDEWKDAIESRLRDAGLPDEKLVELRDCTRGQISEEASTALDKLRIQLRRASEFGCGYVANAQMTGEELITAMEEVQGLLGGRMNRIEWDRATGPMTILYESCSTAWSTTYEVHKAITAEINRYRGAKRFLDAVDAVIASYGIDPGQMSDSALNALDMLAREDNAIQIDHAISSLGLTGITAAAS